MSSEIRTKRRRPSFILKVDPEAVEVKFGFDIVSNLGAVPMDNNDTTNLTDLPGTHPVEIKTLSFMDESKQTHKCHVTMFDYLSKDSIPLDAAIKCFWCRNSFETYPIGCPISYIPSKITKRYHSEITKDKYSITDNVTEHRRNILSSIVGVQDSKFEISDDHGEYFLIDGVFCSFNCCIAFIKDRKRNASLYADSEDLLYSLYHKTVGKRAACITPAPHWRLLKEYGGHMTIEEFRAVLGRAEYVDHDDFKYNAPISTRIIGNMFEKKVRF